MQTPNPETPPSGTSRIPNLADWRFNRYLTMQLMPLFYLLLIVGALVVVVSVVGLCFWFSTLAGIIPTATFVSTLWFNKLPANLQNIILEEGKKLDKEMYEFSLKERKFLQGLWVKNGGELIQLPPAEKKKLMAKMETVGATVVAKNAAVKKVYERLLKVAAKHRK